MPKVILPTPPGLGGPRTILGGLAPAPRRGAPRAKVRPAWERAAPRRASETPRSPEVELALLYHRRNRKPRRA